jgi:hypothetical protein
MKRGICLVVVLLTSTVGAAWSAPTHYDVMDLGAVELHAVDDSGIAAGAILTPERQAALFMPQAVPLGDLPEGDSSTALALRLGWVVGSAVSADGTTHAFVHRFGVMQQLSTAGLSPVTSIATGVNRRTIVGYALASVDAGFTPAVWAIGPGGTLGTLQTLPTLGGLQGFADAINVAGLIVGAAENVTGDFQATLWVGGFPVSLDRPEGTFSRAVAINDEGHVAGVALFGVDLRGFFWTQSLGMQNLGLLPGDVESKALALNNLDVLVGMSTSPDIPARPTRAVRWVTGEIVDLNTLITAPGWVLDVATGINDHGVIAGNGHLNGEAHGFLLVPREGE